MFNELLKNVMNLGIITDDDVKQLTAIELMMLIIERINGLLLHVNSVDGKLDALLEEVNKITIEELNKWTHDGTFDSLINQSALKKVNDRIDETNAQLSDVSDVVEKIKNESVFKNGVLELPNDFPKLPFTVYKQTIK